MSEPIDYKWKSQPSGMKVSQLRQVQDENAKLKRMPTWRSCTTRSRTSLTESYEPTASRDRRSSPSWPSTE